MKILVVIVSYNGSRWIPACADGLRRCGLPVDLYVYDNASTDGSAEAWEEAWPGATLVRSRANDGFTAANNAGFRHALAGDYDAVYLLNQDAWFGPDTLAKLAAAMERHPEYALLSPMQQAADGAPDANFRRDVLPRAGAEQDGICEVPRVMAAHWLVSRKALETVGLFEPLLPLYGQDDNWCDRALYHGFRIGFLPDAPAVHDRAERREPKERIIYRNYYMGSLVRLLDIRRPLWRQRLYVLLFTFVKTFKYASFRPVKHYCSLLKQMRDIRAARACTCQTQAYV